MKFGLQILLLLFSMTVYAQQQGVGQCVRGNCVTGFGTLQFPQGAKYTGEFKNGTLHGKGIFYFTNGNKYIGEWKNNKRQGTGKLFFKNGDVYNGAFIANKMHGQGTMDYIDGTKYTGEWLNDHKHGQGSYYLLHAERYEGNFVQNAFEGKGKYVYKDGSYFIGNWKNGKKQGYGELVTVYGSRLTGEWNADQQIKVFTDDPVVTNENKQNTKPRIEPNTDKSKQSKPPTSEEQIPDCSKEFCKQGKGMLVYADGSKYIGAFVDGQPKGRGICHYSNGDRYEGQWDQHAPHGEGIMYFASGLVYGANWNHGQATKQNYKQSEFKIDNNIQVEETKEVKIWAVIVGVASYSHMPALKFSDDDAYRIYAHLKSPEGGALKDDHIKILIDDDATRNNILKAMQDVFLKADENDVIMMYFSGHGLEGTFLPIDYNGFEHVLSHEEVKKIFEKSKAKHKICYADACYSGSLLASKGNYSADVLNFYEELDKVKGGTAFFLSSKSKEYSLEDGGLRQGIFSHFLIRGLKGEADTDSSKIVTIRELFDFVHTNVRQYTGNIQSPLLAGDYSETMPVSFIRQ